MKKCQHCGKDNPEKAKFCGYCGHILPTYIEVFEPAKRQRSFNAFEGNNVPQRTYLSVNQSLRKMPQGNNPNRLLFMVLIITFIIILLILLCGVLTWINRDNLPGIGSQEINQRSTVENILSPNEIAGTVQAQIVMTQTASVPTASNTPKATNTPEPTSTPTPLSEAEYLDAVNTYLTNCSADMKTINDLMISSWNGKTAQIPNWQTDFDNAITRVGQTSITLRGLGSPESLKDVQTEVISATDQIDASIKYLKESISENDREKTKQYADASNEAKKIIKRIKDEIDKKKQGSK